MDPYSSKIACLWVELHWCGWGAEEVPILVRTRFLDLSDHFHIEGYTGGAVHACLHHNSTLFYIIGHDLALRALREMGRMLGGK